MARKPVAGEYAPRFHAAAIGGLPNYDFQTVAGRPVLLGFLGNAATAAGVAALQAVAAQRAWFDDSRAAFFGITSEPTDWTEGRVAPSLPGIRFFADPGGRIAALFGVGAPCWIVLDRMLRLCGEWPIEDAAAAFAGLAAVRASEPAAESTAAPVLVLPRVFEPDFCRSLIAAYDAQGGNDSGFMRDVGGKTMVVVDHSFKRRSDVIITDQTRIADIRARIQLRLLPAIAQAFHYKVTRMERYLVARYDSTTGGFFRPHRDNTTFGTAHRRFAVTLNLNAEDYDGGELRFPEFGDRCYRAPTGGAVVFSCSLLHEATPVTRGQRYAFLPFLYDDEAAAVREANNAFLGDGVEPYHADSKGSGTGAN